MMTRPMQRQHGFTLLEMVLVIMIMGIMALAGAQMFTGGVGAYNATSEALDTLGKTRAAMAHLTRELRDIRYLGTQYDISTMTATRLVFTKRDGETVTIERSLPNVTLSYASLGVSSPLTDQVADFTFGYYTSDGQSAAVGAAEVAYIEVQLDLIETGTIYSRRQRVALREKP